MKMLRGLVAAVAVFALAGCGAGEPKMYPVSGKVALSGGDPQRLAGHYVEAALDGDPTVRASGVIGADGTFTLETLYAGTILKGAREGTYHVRIVPADEDDNGKKLKQPPVAARHLKFETSGLALQVPASGNVTLELSAR